MKLLLLLFFGITSQIVYGQIAKDMPIEEEWQSYFYAKKESIQKKLFELALSGKIKAYENDSLVSAFNLTDLKMRGMKEVITPLAKNTSYDSVYYKPFDRDFKEFWFCQTILSSPFDETEINSFKALALTFRAEFGGVITPTIPFCWFSVKDLKLILNKNEYEWIMLVYYYTTNDNNIKFREYAFSDNDIYYDINNLKSAYNVYYCDSLMLKKIGNSIRTSYFYINNYLTDKQAGIPDLLVIYDFQKKQHISYNQFQATYYTELVDSAKSSKKIKFSITIPWELVAPISIVIDSSNYEIQTFNFENWEAYPGDGKAYKFSMKANKLRELNTIPTIFWFFEDYFRWKK